jgi:hypothetical protein
MTQLSIKFPKYSIEDFDNIFMTVGDIQKACKKHKYILLRLLGGRLVCVNSKVMKMGLNTGRSKSQTTDYIGLIPCSFNEYINYKVPFK